MIPRWELVPFVDGTGIDPVGPKPLPFRHMARVMPDQLDMIAEDSLDYVVLRDRVPTKVLHDLWSKLKHSGRLVLWAPKDRAMHIPRELGQGYGWTWIWHDEDADSILQVYRRRVDGRQREAIERPAARRAGVVRPGGYGDALMASSILPQLVAEGYEVTVYVERWGAEALLHDPNIRHRVCNSVMIVGREQLGEYWEHERQKFDLWINLSDSVEGSLAFRNEALASQWPHALRKDVARVSYLQRVHDAAGLPHEYAQKMHLTPDEVANAMVWFASWGEDEAVVCLVDSGSHAQKWWPHAGDFALELVTGVPGVRVVFLGEIRSRVPEHPRITKIGTSLSFREAAAIAMGSDVVVGQDSGLMQAVGMEERVAKVVLHAITSPLNITAQWPNTVSVVPENTDCFPCHILHRNWDLCRRHAETGAAACQVDIPRGRVMEAVLDRLVEAVPL